MATRAEMIDAILARRHRRNEDLEELRTLVEALSAGLSGLAAPLAALTSGVHDAAGTVLDQIGQDAAELERRCAAAHTEIDRCAARFRRPSLTIGMIGRSGQGKSQLLQSLTGLTDREIPAGRGSFVTGVPSHIRHASGTEVSAEIEFHDEATFMEEVVGRYYTALDLGAAPAGLDEFARTEVPELAPEAASTEAQAARDHLLSYRASLGEYRSRLTDRTRTLAVGPDEIRGYVAQHDAQGQPIHQFRAVRLVRIATPFGEVGKDLGQVSLIDLPGLGDTNLGDIELLRRALGSEVDVAVFVKRPDPFRFGVEEVDVRLYDAAWAALPELPLDRWSFVLLNKVSGELDNSAGVKGYQDELRRSRIRVVDVVTADCSRPAEVAEAFETVFGQLVSVVDGLDRILLERRRQELGALAAAVRALLDRAQEVDRFASGYGTDEAEFLRLFSPVKEDLYQALEGLVARYFEMSGEADPELALAVEQALTPQGGTSAMLPDETELLRRHAVRGGWAGVLEDFVLEERAAISRRFLDLEGPLTKRVEAMHEDVAAVLAGPGGLRAIAPGLTALEFLKRLADRVPVDELTEEIRTGLGFVCEFTLHYRGLLQHRVRRALQDLAPDRTEIPAELTAADIHMWLEDNVDEAFGNLREALTRVLSEPMEAVFAVVEEFRDRALRAKRDDLGWQVIYQHLRVELWPERFEALARNTAVFQDWSAALAALREATVRALDHAA